jgi:DNA-binding Lrp family transcriptional regulator
MATKAYVLVEVASGQIRQVVAALREMPGLTAADPVAGPYDIILVFEADDLASIGNMVTEHVHTVPGIIRTVTCLAME